VRRLLAPLALASVLVASLVAPAAAARPTREPYPFPEEGILLPAGDVCDFEVLLEAVVNQEYLIVFPADEEGRQRSIVSGRLVERVTNVATGESLTYNVSGPGIFWANPDGTTDMQMHGRNMLWFFKGERHGPGLYVTTGLVRQTLEADGTIPNAEIRGRMIDVCAALE
jgi:hypothetical protein